MGRFSKIKSNIQGGVVNYIKTYKRDCIDETINLFKNNLKAVLIFIIFNLFISLFATTFLVEVLIDFLMRISGETYICNENIVKVFSTPYSFVAIVIFGIFVSYIALFELGALFHAFALSRTGRGDLVTLHAMVGSGIAACKKISKPMNWLAVPFVVVILPFTGILNIQNTSLKVLIPGFIEQFLLSNSLYSVLLLSLYFALTLLVLYFIYSLNFFTMGDDNFLISCKKSVLIMRGQLIRTIVTLLIFNLLFSLLVSVASAVIAALYKELTDYIYMFTGNNADAVSLTEMYKLAGNIYTVSSILKGIMLPVLNIAALSTLFFNRLDEESRVQELSKDIFKEEKIKIGDLIFFVLICIVIVAYNIVGFYHSKDAYTCDTDSIEIIAHRGDSVRAPENTMPAFKLAIEEHADGIELDVHETKDGVIIVSHDDDLTRVSGKHVFVHDLTYDEVQQLECGSWFSERYRGTKLSTLDEVLKEVYKNAPWMTVQIEIKPTNFDHEIEEKVLKIINDNNMHDRVTIVSLKAKPLQRMKELDKTISTTYCMAVAWGDIQNIPWTDNLSVEENNINPNLVYSAKKVAKNVYAWTVNNESTVQFLQYCGITGVLTDDPDMMDDALYLTDEKGGFRKLLYLLTARFVRGY